MGIFEKIELAEKRKKQNANLAEELETKSFWLKKITTDKLQSTRYGHIRILKEEGDICPACKIGKFRVIGKGQKPFLGCSNYPNCKYNVSFKNIGGRTLRRIQKSS